MPADQIQYSEKYYDDLFEYRHVILPQDLAKHVPKSHLMTETEWRNLGVQQSPGWVHYMMHTPVVLRQLRFPRTTRSLEEEPTNLQFKVFAASQIKLIQSTHKAIKLNHSKKYCVLLVLPMGFGHHENVRLDGSRPMDRTSDWGSTH
uniref:Cyclin-dependent kinases regulatory subunit n=1 Tax=Timema bartmani TaxID=61472 RepID=A0A7R9F2D6_9NEOP|nr:unnamed protein product [Timema bartmani]